MSTYISALLGFLSFGGITSNNTLSKSVHWISIDGETSQSCLHSELPFRTKEVHVVEFQDTLLACSAYTKVDSKNLQCWKWSGALGWENYTTPENNGIFGFISAVKVPNVGIWYIDDQGLALMLREDGTWSSDYYFNKTRERACAVLISPTKVAHIGGTPASIGVKFLLKLLLLGITYNNIAITAVP